MAQKVGGSLAEKAYLVIREQILRGQLPLGCGLSRRALAAELGMSMAPVSEALQRLASEGLVESRPRVGTLVRVPTEKQVREHYIVREALESQSARLFAAKASLRERQEVQRMAETMDALFEQCVGSQRSAELVFAAQSHHFALHTRIAHCTGCEALWIAIEKSEVLAFNWLYDVAARRPPLPAGFHRDLVEVLSKGDVEAADRAMRAHVQYGFDSIVSGIRFASGFDNVESRSLHAVEGREG
ncbi:MAG: GntR family transcriptional regulator [Candidatus Solibacter sp.]